MPANLNASFIVLTLSIVIVVIVKWVFNFSWLMAFLSSILLALIVPWIILFIAINTPKKIVERKSKVITKKNIIGELLWQPA
jgi:hypothetical protein